MNRQQIVKYLREKELIKGFKLKNKWAKDLEVTYDSKKKSFSIKGNGKPIGSPSSQPSDPPRPS